MFDKTKKHWCLVEKLDGVGFIPGLYFTDTSRNLEWQLCDVHVSMSQGDPYITFKPIDKGYASRSFDVASLAKELEKGSIVEFNGHNQPVLVKYYVPITATVNRVDMGYVIE